MDDAELVCLVLQGNLDAYGDLVYRYTAQIAAVCRAHVFRFDGIEDLVQETFFRGLNRLAGLREPGRFGAWLYAIARNLCRDWLNDPHRDHLSLEAVAPVLVADAPAAADRTADLRQCIRCLPVELREVVEIYYSGGRVTYRELADRLDVSPVTVNQWLTRARRMLRDWLDRCDPPESRPA
jgi:RNA polymerase sigma-70 factor (ECF subfamily)